MFFLTFIYSGKVPLRTDSLFQGHPDHTHTITHTHLLSAATGAIRVRSLAQGPSEVEYRWRHHAGNMTGAQLFSPWTHLTSRGFREGEREGKGRKHQQEKNVNRTEGHY